MRSLTEQDIRGSFVDCSKGGGQASVRTPRSRGAGLERAGLPGLAGGRPDRSYLVAASEGRPVGVAMRFQPARRGFLHRSMCSLCLTTHPRGGVSLMTACRAGAAGREGNSVGAYLCTDLACSLYLRGKKVPETGLRFEEALTLEEQIARTLNNLHAFLDKV
ncbi:FBP domain-containing protein [Streptomyces sp. GD-15H]|uniref:FBP domain-containing protein n=1 Tax=Streptomyces sp. GD-15H TaxID=3129112 RepID=UPI0032522F7C